MGAGNVQTGKCCSHSHHINFCSHSEQHTYSHSHGNPMGPVGIHWFPLSCTLLVKRVIIPRWSSLQCFEMGDRKGIQPVRENSALIIPKASVLSVLWCCWLGSRKGIRPVKTEWWGTGVVICLERCANALRMVQLMPLPPHYVLLQ